jgi:hypothetical protein
MKAQRKRTCEIEFYLATFHIEKVCKNRHGNTFGQQQTFVLLAELSLSRCEP